MAAIDRVLGVLFDMVMKKRWAQFLDDQENPNAAQESALQRIVAVNKNTRFGRDRGFPALAGLRGRELWRAYRASVPITPYDGFLPAIEEMKQGRRDILVPGAPEMFSLTSGTTAAPKLCPVTPDFIKELHRPHLLWMYRAFTDHPRLNGGKYLVMASPAEMGKTPGGTAYGAMSGKQLSVQSIPVRRRMAAPFAIQLQKNAMLRWLNTILFALAAPDLRVVTALNPSTLVTIANKMGENAEELSERLTAGRPWTDDNDDPAVTAAVTAAFRRRPDRAKQVAEILRVEGTLPPAAVWPDLEMLFTWQSGSSSFYLPYVSAAWGQTAQRCLGLRASEGNFSIPLHDNNPSGTLAVGGHVMEFIPAEIEDIRPNAQTLLPTQLEIGKLYRMVVTTSGGFYRYDLGDLVEVTGVFRKTPEIAFIRRAGSVLSVTGEKITENQAVDAMRAAGENNMLLNGFTLTWEMAPETRYVLAVECAGGEKLFFQRRSMMREKLTDLLTQFDEELMLRNCEYEAKRNDGRLAAPRLILLADDTYRRHRAALADKGSPENQVKVPHLVTPPGPGRAPVKGCPFFDAARIVAEL